MPIPVICQSCEAKLNAPDAAAGRKVKCPKCRVPILIPTPPTEELDLVEVQPQPEPVVTATPPVDDEDAPTPKKPRKPVADEADDDDRPAPRKRRQSRLDDEDDDRPRPRKRRENREEPEPRKKGSGMLVFAILGGVVLLGGAGAAIYFFTQDDSTPQVADRTRTNPQPNPFFPPNPEPQKPIDPPVTPVPSGPLVPTDLSPIGIRATLDLPAGTVFGKSISQFTLPGGKIIYITKELVSENPNSKPLEEHIAKGTVSEVAKNAILVTEPPVGSFFSYNMCASLVAGNDRYTIVEVAFTTKPAEAMAVWAILKTFRQTEAQKNAEKPRTEALAKLTAGGQTVGSAEDMGLLVIVKEPNEAVSTALADLPDLTTIQIPSSESFTPALAKQLPHLKQLRTLELPGADSELAVVGQCKGLTELILTGSTTTDAGLASLSELKNLKKLDIHSNSRINGQGLAVLPKLLKLQDFSINYAPIQDAELRHLTGLKELRNLQLITSTITDAGVKHLTGLPELTRLNLSESAITGATLDALRSSPKLSWLNLSDSAITDAGLRQITGLSVNYLNLSHTRVGDSSLAVFAKWKGLTHLYLPETNVTDAGMSALAGTQVQHLDLSETAVTDQGVAALEGAKELSRLILTDCPVTDAVLMSALKLPKLEALTLTSTNLTNAALTPLSTLVKTKGRFLTVDLFQTQVTDAAAKAATREDICRVAASPKSEPIPAKASALPPTPLDKLKPADPEKLFKTLESKPELDEDAPGKPIVGLYLSRENPPIMNLDLAEIRNLTTLRRLVISSESITDGGLAYLSGLTNLEELSISSDGITGSGLIHLQKLTKLKKLTLPQPKDEMKFTAEDLRPLTAIQGLEEILVWEIKVESLNVLLDFYSRFPNLKRLAILTNLKNANMLNFPKLESVEELKLSSYSSYSTVTMRGWSTARLAGMKSLQKIHFGFNIDDGTAMHISKAKNLREITVSTSTVSSVGYQALSGLPELKSLILMQPHLDAESLKFIAATPKLSYLSVNNGTLTDPSLSGLAGAKELLQLRINSKSVTDAALPGLAKLPKLRFVDLNGTSVSKEGIAKLQKEKPDLEIAAHED